MSFQILTRFNQALNLVSRLRMQRRILSKHLSDRMIRLRGCLKAIRILEIDILNLQARNAQLDRQVLRLQEDRDMLRERIVTVIQEERRISQGLLDDMSRDLEAARESAYLATVLRQEMSA